MLTKQELKELASYKLEDAIFISLFLNVDPKLNPKGDWQKHYKNLVRDAATPLSAEQKADLQKDLDKIEHYLSDRPDGLKRGLAIVSSTKAKVWKVVHTAIPFDNEVVIDRDPYIKPLVSMMNLHQRYLVVIVDQEKVRLHIIGFGEINEVKLIEKPAIEFDPDKDGAVGDLAHNRLEKVKEKERRGLFKAAVAEMEKLVKFEEIQRILLAGTDANRGRLKDALPEPLKNMLYGEFAVDHYSGAADILAKSQPVLHGVEKRLEQDAVHELFSQVGKAEGAVLGLSDVLTVIQQGNIRKLYALKSTKVQGMACTACGALTPERDKPCPYCGGTMEYVPYMIDMAIQRAIELGAHVGMLEESPDLHKAGGIGAVLRY